MDRRSMNPYLTVIFWAALVVLVSIGLILKDNHRRKTYALRRVRRTYGNVPEREYEAGDLEQISRYFQRKKEKGFVIDDITWNDLDMDHIYMLVNQTMSSPGEDVLYNMMRTPFFEKEEQERRDALIGFFAAHQEEREKLQVMLSAVGKTSRGSLSDTVLSLNEAPKASPFMHGVMAVLLLLTLLVLLPVSPLHGFLAFFILSMFNISYYFACKDRKLVESYLVCFGSLLRMLSVADELEAVKWPETKKQMDAIREGKKAFASFRKKAVFLTSKNEMSGDPLQIVMEYVRMVFHVDILTYNPVLREVRDKTDKIMDMLDNIGELDAAISIASFREMLSLTCRPEFVPYEGGPVEMDVTDLYHPLICEPVANSISAKGGILVTGSNASGKSTFLKNIAINAILAQTIGTCVCSSYRAPFFRVLTSMALRDDLSEGDSYFIVEIKSMKRILDESQKNVPMLCIIDEVLRGTNTIERIAASSRILGSLVKEYVLAFAATHDIELTYILEGVYTNYHFEEEVREHEVVFNYLLQEGRAKSRNAIRLLGMLEYDAKLVEEAQKAAGDFEKTGVWKRLLERKEELC